MTLAEEVRQRRESLGLSKAALGRIVGVTGQAVGLWESGARDISLESLERIALALRTSALQLQGGTDPDNLNVDLLAKCLTCVESAAAAIPCKLSATQHAKILAYIYSKNAGTSQEEVVALIKLVI